MFRFPGCLATGTLMVCVAWPAFSQDADTERKCRRSATAFEARVASCNALLESPDFENRTWAWERLGDAYNDADQEEASLEYYVRALEIAPDYPDALSGRAVALFQLDREEEALRDTAHLMRVEPEDHWNFYYHGRILLWQDKYEEALEYLGRSIELRGDYFFSHYRRADALTELDRQ